MELENSSHLDTGTYWIVDQFCLVVTILGYTDFYSLVDTGLGLNHYADSKRDKLLTFLVGTHLCLATYRAAYGYITFNHNKLGLLCFTSLFDLNRFLSVLLIVNAFLVIL